MSKALKKQKAEQGMATSDYDNSENEAWEEKDNAALHSEDEEWEQSLTRNVDTGYLPGQRMAEAGLDHFEWPEEQT